MQLKRLDAITKKQLQDLHKLCFNDGDFYIDYFLKKHFAKSWCFIEKESKSQIIGVLYARPIKIKIGCSVQTIPFITGVATHPNWRNRGVARKLLDECSSFFKHHKIPFIMLYPFNHEFYKKQFFETINYFKSSSSQFNLNALSHNLEDFKRPSSNMNKGYGFSFSDLELNDFKLCKTIYDFSVKDCLSYQVRSNKYFLNLFLEHFGDSGKGILISFEKEPIGYVLFNNQEIRESVLSPIYQSKILPLFDKLKIPASFPIEDKADLDSNLVLQSNLAEKSYLNITEYTMARLCDTVKLLKYAMYQTSIDNTIVIAINNTVYSVSVKNGKATKVTKNFLKTTDELNLLKEKCVSSNKIFINCKDEKELTAAALGNTIRNSLWETIFCVYNIIIYDKY